MMERVRVGVIGTSGYAQVSHLPRMASHPQADLVAVCGRDRDRAIEVGTKYAIPQVYTDYRQMIEQEGLDAVVISTPDDLHYEMAIAALDAGLHVLCEKPLALDRKQAQEMLAKAEDAGVVHMVCFTYRWLPHYRYLRHLLDLGYVGCCYHCRLEYVGGHARQGHSGWRFDRQRASGVLGDLGSHMIDLARWCVGEIVRVSAHLGNYAERVDSGGASDAALLAVEFEGGAQGVIQVSAVAHTGEQGQEQRVVLYGDAGTLQVYGSATGAKVRGIRDGEQCWQDLPIPDELWAGVNQEQPFVPQVLELFCRQPVGDRQFVDAILSGARVTPSFLDGLRVQEVLDGAIASHEQGRWVQVGGGTESGADV